MADWLRAGLSYPAYCNVFFGTHGCDLSAGHPPELGHVCLEADYDLLPDQGGFHDPVELSLICRRADG